MGTRPELPDSPGQVLPLAEASPPSEALLGHSSRPVHYRKVHSHREQRLLSQRDHLVSKPDPEPGMLFWVTMEQVRNCRVVHWRAILRWVTRCQEGASPLSQQTTGWAMTLLKELPKASNREHVLYSHINSLLLLCLSKQPFSHIWRTSHFD